MNRLTLLLYNGRSHYVFQNMYAALRVFLFHLHFPSTSRLFALMFNLIPPLPRFLQWEWLRLYSTKFSFVFIGAVFNFSLPNASELLRDLPASSISRASTLVHSPESTSAFLWLELCEYEALLYKDSSTPQGSSLHPVPFSSHLII